MEEEVAGESMMGDGSAVFKGVAMGGEKHGGEGRGGGGVATGERRPVEEGVTTGEGSAVEEGVAGESQLVQKGRRRY